MNYTQRSYVNGKWENMYPATTAEQVTTDENHKFVTDAQIKEFSQKSQISIGETAPTEPEDYIAMMEPSELLCQIQHNLNGYPNVLLLEGRYTAGTGGAGDGPAGGEELTQYPCRQTYQDANNLTVFTVKKFAELGDPIINKISDYVYTLTYSSADSLYIKLLLNI